MTKPDDFQDDPITVPDGTNLPSDDLLEEPFEEDGDQTPTSAPSTCFRKCGVDAVVIDAPAPTSTFEVGRLPTCIASKRGDWALCAVSFWIRLGGHEFYFGPDRRTTMRDVGVERRRPPIPPRQDDQPKGPIT
jgi:hypothetical protein